MIESLNVGGAEVMIVYGGIDVTFVGEIVDGLAHLLPVERGSEARKNLLDAGPSLFAVGALCANKGQHLILNTAQTLDGRVD